MFTGIIEATGKIDRIVVDEGNKHFLFSSPISRELKIDQSVSHNGVCLTITKVAGNSHWATAIDETLRKSSLHLWKEGDVINLERSMLMNGRLDGHLVQGHVDQTGTCKAVRESKGSWLFEFEFDASLGNVTVEKGSVTVDGVSLTCFNAQNDSFTVAIIPYTFEHTNFNRIRPGSTVNLEFDIVGKYVKKILGKT